MEKKKGMPGWIKGCLTGCGVLVVLAILLLTFVCNRLGRMIEGVRDAESSFEQLVEELGDFKDYAPVGDISLKPDRVELFLWIREEMAGDRAALSRVFHDFPIQELKEMENEEPAPVMVWTVVKQFAGLLNPVGEYIANRNEALIRERMSLGEYSWIYSLAFYSWLGHEMDAAPGLGGEAMTDWGDDDSPLSPDAQRRRYRRVMLRLLSNRVESLPDEAVDLRAGLETELRRVENAPSAIVWESGLPAGEAMVLEPFRERLEATWHPDTNVLELPFEERRGGKFQYRVN